MIPQKYRALIPPAINWLQAVEKHCLENGRALTDPELKDAISTGVQHPHLIRLLSVDGIAQPDDPQLMQAALETGLLGENATARAVGYGIEIANSANGDAVSRSLLRHEFRHVYQFERAGSLESFITSYISAVLTDGYYDCEYEQDARAFEMMP